MQVCPDCKIKKERTEFHKCKDRWNGLSYRCKRCDSIAGKIKYKKNKEKIILNSKTWANNNPEKRKEITGRWYENNKEQAKKSTRNSRLKSEYGITEEQFEEMLKSQNSCCKICGSTESNVSTHNKLVVDHNHETSKVRGLLCNKCNLGLGRFNDDIELLRKAVKYLEEND